MAEIKKTAAQRLAHAVRIVSAPPVMVAALLVLLWFFREDVYGGAPEFFVSLLCLAVLPVLAYPVSVLIPAIRQKGRDGQRSLAIYFSAVGYLAVFIYGFAAQVGRNLMLVYAGYFFSVVIILLFNKLLHVRASGHACSVSGPLMYTAYFLGLWGIVVGTALWGIIFWASLVMKRHTVSEFILGTATCLASFFSALLIF